MPEIKPDRYWELRNKWLNQKISEKEKEELLSFFADEDDFEVHLREDSSSSSDELKQRIFNSIDLPIRQKNKFRTWRIAAILILMAGIGSWFYNSYHAAKSPVYSNSGLAINEPEGQSPNSVQLLSSDGKIIELDSLTIGQKTEAGNLQKTGNQAISFAGSAEPGGVNTLLVPKGNQYELELPDGSRVWLNAASSLKFPAKFTDSERRVELDGEAYFEISKNKSKPFYVLMNDGTELKVLGTHFNISSYKEDGVVKTSLLEGAVQLQRDASKLVLSPGQQAIGRAIGGLRHNNSFDEEEVMGWREGKYKFQNADIRLVLNQVARWYDVTIQYEDEIHAKFNGIILKSNGIDKIFDLLSLTQAVSFTRNGQNIIVKKAKK
jgi:hypothetical protein